MFAVRFHRQFSKSDSFPSQKAKFRIDWIDDIVHFLNRHKIAIVIFAVFLLVWATRDHQYAIDDYTFIPDDSVPYVLVHETVPNLTHAADKPKCDYKGIISENRFVFRAAYQKSLNDTNGIRAGGEFIPSDCVPQFSTAVIIPYRNREEQLNAFIHYIHNYLRLQKIHYRIFLVEQSDKKPFNRAKLLNVGAVYAIKDNFPCLIFHDVDLFPMNLGNLYVCSAQPRHLAVNIDKFRFNLPFGGYFGGSVSMQQETFLKINGMSNMYWAWGAEDDDLLERLKYKQIDIFRFGPNYGQYLMYKHKQEQPSAVRDEIFKNATARISTDGMNSLNYTVKSFRLTELYTHILVDL